MQPMHSLAAFKAPPQTLLPSLLHAQSLLADPNPNSPANGEAARLYNDNRCVQCACAFVSAHALMCVRVCLHARVDMQVYMCVRGL